MAGEYEYTTISRDTWTIAMNGLASRDPDVRGRAYTRLLVAGPPGWEADVDDPDPVPQPTIPPADQAGP
ncbi:hypothetical protein [Actinomadura sp. GTD37]|uniref:hypothetical protein n=1 Tax=Actinomadura sp. GTD37 TaxID=1778030 RepID=UPI0035BFCE72